jgi:hypothetical protein
MIPAIIEAALRSLLVGAAVWAGLRALRVSNVLAQKAAWALVLAAAVLMPLVMHWQWLPAAVVLPTHPLVRSWSLMRSFGWPAKAAFPADRSAGAASPAFTQVDSPAPAEPVYAPESVSAGVSHFPAPVVSRSSQAAPVSPANVQPSAPARQRLQPAGMALLFYLAVSGCLLLRLLFGLGSALRLWFKAEPVPMRSLPLAYIGLAYGLRLRSSRDLASPVTIGSGVVLPADYAEWDAEKLRIVLAHERSHVRQGDFYLQTLAGLYAVLFWFSPLGWWLKRKLSDLSETISDRAGLREAASRSIYAQILLEFAVAPRPTLQGVAMARSSNLSTRIERLLNDSTFRQAFVGSRRAFIAVLLVPVALVFATALIRVDAASQAPKPDPQAAPQAQTAPAIAGQARPEEGVDADTAPEAAEPTDPEAQVSGAPPAPMAPPAPDSPRVPGLPAMAPLPPLPPGPPDFDDDQSVSTSTSTNTNTNTNTSTGRRQGRGNRYNYSYNYNSDGGDSYAIVKGDKEHANFSGDWYHGRKEDFEKARKMALGDFLWFTRDSKSYIVDDPAIVAQIDAMYKPMEELGKQQEELGRQQEKLGEEQERLGRQQEQASIPTPDISKEMADLNASMAKLQSKMGKTVTQGELADLEGKLGELQGRLGELQGEMGARQGEFGAQQGKLGGMQGELGARQGKIGAEQGRIAQEADRKVKSIIDQSLKDGKARPVQ